ncbi:hypothetical protein LCGC14_1516150, partial [marine sediment metagenome]
KKYPCTIEEALKYINAYSTAIATGKVVIKAKDDKDRPSDSGAGAPEDNKRK